jgi:uncharacterized membrane protein YhaH (DUF805 family)
MVAAVVITGINNMKNIMRMGNTSVSVSDRAARTENTRKRESEDANRKPKEREYAWIIIIICSLLFVSIASIGVQRWMDHRWEEEFPAFGVCANTSPETWRNDSNTKWNDNSTND